MPAPRRRRSMPSRCWWCFSAVAALYESWTIPFVNLLMLPLGLVGAVTAVTLRVLPNDVYLQIGLLTTVGLSTKNAILIIQFIKEQMHQGHELVEATLAAVKIRLRPVIMTSLAFFFGTLPLALTNGAGRRGPERHRHRRDRRPALGHLHRPDLYPVFLCPGFPAVCQEEAVGRTIRRLLTNVPEVH